MPTTTVSNNYTNKITDLDLDSTAEQLHMSSKSLRGAEFDNSQNTAKSYAKLYNSASAVSVGTTVPDYVIPCPAGAIVSIIFGDDGAGETFSAGTAIAGVTTGGVAGSTPPVNALMATLLTF